MNKNIKIIKIIIVILVILIIILILATIKNEFLEKFERAAPYYLEITYLDSLILLPIINSLISLGFVFCCAFLFGKWSARETFCNPLKENEIKDMQGYRFIPFPGDLEDEKVSKVYSWEHHCRYIVIFPKEIRAGADKTIFIKRYFLIIGFTFILMMLKDYFVVNGKFSFGLSHPFINSILDVFFFGIIIFTGIALGNKLFEYKFTCRYGSLWRPVIISEYICCPIGGGAIFVCPLGRLSQFSIRDAEEVYNVIMPKK